MQTPSPDPVPAAAALPGPTVALLPPDAPAPIASPDTPAGALPVPLTNASADVSPGPQGDALPGFQPDVLGAPVPLEALAQLDAAVPLEALAQLDAAASPGALAPLDVAVSLDALVPLDTWFSLAGAVAMAGWLALVVFPRSPLVTDRLVGLGVPAALGVLYAGLILAFWAGSPGGFGSLDEVSALFSVRGLLLAGWVHYLAFDLFVGAWEVRTARAEAIPHLLVVPCLLMTFLFGPVGLLMFLALRLAVGLWRRTAGTPA